MTNYRLPTTLSEPLQLPIKVWHETSSKHALTRKYIEEDIESEICFRWKSISSISQWTYKLRDRVWGWSETEIGIGIGIESGGLTFSLQFSFFLYACWLIPFIPFVWNQFERIVVGYNLTGKTLLLPEE